MPPTGIPGGPSLGEIEDSADSDGGGGGIDIGGGTDPGDIRVDIGDSGGGGGNGPGPGGTGIPGAPGGGVEPQPTPEPAPTPTGPGPGGTGIPGAPGGGVEPQPTPEPAPTPTGPGPGGTGIPDAPSGQQPDTSPQPSPAPDPADVPTGPGPGGTGIVGAPRDQQPDTVGRGGGREPPRGAEFAGSGVAWEARQFEQQVQRQTGLGSEDIRIRRDGDMLRAEFTATGREIFAARQRGAVGGLLGDPAGFDRGGAAPSSPAGGFQSVRGGAPGVDDPAGVFVGVGTPRQTEPSDIDTETIGAAGPLGVTVPVDREPAMTAGDVWGFVSRDVGGPPGVGVPSGRGQDVPRGLPGDIFGAVTTQPEGPPGVGVLTTPADAEPFAEIIPGSGTFQGPVDVPEGAPGVGVMPGGGPALGRDISTVFGLARENIDSPFAGLGTVEGPPGPPDDAPDVVGAAGPLGVPETGDALPSLDVQVTEGTGEGGPVTVPRGAPGAGVLPGTGTPEDFQRFLGAPLGLAALTAENVDLPTGFEPGAAPERQSTQRELFGPTPTGPFTGTTVAEAIGQDIERTIVTEAEAEALPEREEQFGDFDPVVGGVAVEPTLRRASIGFSQTTGAVAEGVTEPIFGEGTPAQLFTAGAIQGGLSIANLPAFGVGALETAEAASFISEDPEAAIPGLAVATGAAASEAAEAAIENPFATAGAGLGIAATGFAGGLAIERAGMRLLRPRRARRFEVGVGFGEMTSERGFRGLLPFFEAERTAPTRQALSEVRERAADQPTALQEAFGTESILFRSETEALPSPFTAQRGEFELPGLFVSPDASPLRASIGARGSSLIGRPRLPNPFRDTLDEFSAFPGERIEAMPPAARGAGFAVDPGEGGDLLTGFEFKIQADVIAKDVDGKIVPDPETTGAIFLDELAEPGTAFVRPIGSRTPELEAIFPPGSQFVERGVFGIDMPGGELARGRFFERVDADRPGGLDPGDVPERSIIGIEELSQRRSSRQPSGPPFQPPAPGVTADFGGEVQLSEPASGFTRSRRRSDAEAPSTPAAFEPSSVFGGLSRPAAATTTAAVSPSEAFSGPMSDQSGVFSSGPTRPASAPASQPTTPPTGPPSGPTTPPSRPPSGPSGGPPSRPPTIPGLPPGEPSGPPTRPPPASDRPDRDDERRRFVLPTGQEFQNPVATGLEFLFGREAGDFGTASPFGDLGGEERADDVLSLFTGGGQ